MREAVGAGACGRAGAAVLLPVGTITFGATDPADETLISAADGPMSDTAKTKFRKWVFRDI